MLWPLVVTATALLFLRWNRKRRQDPVGEVVP
jgi:amino acid efflux transporter